MAILFPVTMFIILSMFQIALYWHTANTVGVAADIGLDAGQVFPEDHPRAISEAEAAAQWMLDSTNHQNGTPTATINGNLLRVTVVANSPQIVGIGSWQVQSVAEGRFEEFIPADQR